MATRMQQRRGTAAQWVSVNNGNGPILAAGEIGFESDTNKFKIGDGVNHWADLTYFTDAASALDTLNGLIDNAPDLMNTLGEIAAALGDDPNFFTTVATNLSNHESDTTNVHGISNTANLATKAYADGKASDAQTAAENTAASALSSHESDTTNVHGIEDTTQLATISYVDGSVNNVSSTLSSADGVGLAWNATTDQLDFDGSVLGTGLSWDENNNKAIVDTRIAGDGLLWNESTKTIDFDGTITGNGINYTNGVLGLNSDVARTTGGVHFEGITETETLNTTDITATGTMTTHDAVITGNLTVSGTTTTVNTTNMEVSDPIIYIAADNQSNALDVGVVGSYNDGTYAHSGLVRDASDNGTWKLFEGYQAEPGTTIDFNNATYAPIRVGSLIAAGAKIGDVTNAELQYVHGVTSNIQTQINNTNSSIQGEVSTLNQTISDLDSAKQNNLTSSHGVKVFANAKIYHTGISQHDFIHASTGEIIKDGEALDGSDVVISNGISQSVSTWITDLTGTAYSGTFTSASDVVSVDHTKVQMRVTGISDAEIGMLNGATSNIQTQINDRLPIIDASATYAVKNDTVLTGNVTLPSTTTIGDISSTELSYVNGVTSAIQTQIDSKAASSTVSNHTSATTNVHGISDTSKLVATTDTGTVATAMIADSAVSTAKIADGAITSGKIADGTIATADIADSAITSAKIANGTIVDADISSTAAISYSKLNLSGSITSSDIVDGTIVAGDIADGAITSAKILDGTIVNADINAAAAIAATKISGTAVTQADTGTVTNAMLAGSIAASKVSGTAITAADTGTVTSTMIADGTIVNADINASAAIAQSKIANLTTDLAAKAALAGATFTGDVTVPNITVSGNLTVSGTTTTVSSSNLEITDPLIYIGTGNSANANDLGIVGHFNNGTYQHTGLIRDHADGKWKLFSGVTTEPTSGTVSLVGATYDTLKAGTFEGNLTGNVTGNVTGALTGNADTATKLATARNINGVSFDGSAAITVKASTTNALTIGTGLSGTSFDGGSAVTVAIDSTVATLTGTQTLTNKTLTAPSMSNAVHTGTTTVSSSGITFSDGTVQTVAATPSLTPINAQTASITLGSSFVKDSFVQMNVASANTVTIPTDATYTYPVGASIDFQQMGAGQTSFVAASGVTFQVAKVNGVDALKFRGQFSVATALKTAANTWAIFGDLTN